MKIYSRVSDKVLYISLVVCSIVCFILTCAIFSYISLRTSMFWEQASMCREAQDFTCLWTVGRNIAIEKDFIWTSIGTALIVYGLMLSILTHTLFKGFKSKD